MTKETSLVTTHTYEPTESSGLVLSISTFAEKFKHDERSARAEDFVKRVGIREQLGKEYEFAIVDPDTEQYITGNDQLALFREATSKGFAVPAFVYQSEAKNRNIVGTMLRHGIMPPAWSNSVEDRCFAHVKDLGLHARSDLVGQWLAISIDGTWAADHDQAIAIKQLQAKFSDGKCFYLCGQI